MPPREAVTTPLLHRYYTTTTPLRDRHCSVTIVLYRYAVAIRYYTAATPSPCRPSYRYSCRYPVKVVLHAAAGASTPAGWWALNIPAGVTSGDQIPPPTFDVGSQGGEVYDFIAGGVTDGVTDPSVLVGLNGSTLFVRSAATSGQLVTRPLPTRFARPITFPIREGRSILGPVSHGKTVALAVSPHDSALLALTGWASVLDNSGAEGIWLSRDGGLTYTNIYANLLNATAATAKARPSSLLFVRLGGGAGMTALLAGSVSGVFITFISDDASVPPSPWHRLGNCGERRHPRRIDTPAPLRRPIITNRSSSQQIAADAPRCKTTQVSHRWAQV